MPKKKAAEPKTAKPNGLVIRASAEWREWVEELRKLDNRPSAASVIDRALAVYAKKVGMAKPMPDR
jgi:hypothetical protein